MASAKHGYPKIVELFARELQTLNLSLEKRVSERTSALEESRDHLEQFFTLMTALQDPDNLEKTFDLVLRYCQPLGYDRAMLSLVDREAQVSGRLHSRAIVERDLERLRGAGIVRRLPWPQAPDRCPVAP